MAKKNKNSSKNNGIGAIGVIGILLVVVILLFAAIMVGANYFSAAPTGTTSLKDKETQSSLANCPSDGDTSLTVELFNPLNETGSEGFDGTVYVLADDGTIVTSITDTTSPSATTITCGYKYKLAVIAADGDSGDNSQVKAIRGMPSGNDASVVEGMVEFTADRSNLDFDLSVEQHGVLQFRLYDNVDARYAYDSGDAENNAFETDGVTFRDGDNATAFAVAAGGYIDFRLDIQSTGTDTNAKDAYVLVGVEAPVNIWQVPTVKFEGKALSDVKTTGLTTNELIGLTNYEYVYKIDADLLDDTKSLDFYIKALAGANPTADVEIDFFPAGNFLTTSGTGILTGANKDDSSRTVVFTTQDVTIDIS